MVATLSEGDKLVLPQALFSVGLFCFLSISLYIILVLSPAPSLRFLHA